MLSKYKIAEIYCMANDFRKFFNETMKTFHDLFIPKARP